MKKYKISDCQEVEINIGDWVEVKKNLLPSDPVSGLSYEICSLYDNQVGILVKLEDKEAEEVILSTDHIVANYRRVQ